jgi:hypothetical protein
VYRTKSPCRLFNHDSKSSLSNKKSARRGNVVGRNKKADGQVMHCQCQPQTKQFAHDSHMRR